MTLIKTFLRNEKIITIVGVILALTFLPMHGYYELGAIVRMAWWLPFFLYVNEVNIAYKEHKKDKRIKYVWVRPEPNAWVSRWGLSWKTLGIVIPTMLITFFFVMLVVFA